MANLYRCVVTGRIYNTIPCLNYFYYWYNVSTEGPNRLTIMRDYIAWSYSILMDSATEDYSLESLKIDRWVETHWSEARTFAMSQTGDYFLGAISPVLCSCLTCYGGSRLFHGTKYIFGQTDLSTVNGQIDATWQAIVNQFANRIMKPGGTLGRPNQAGLWSPLHGFSSYTHHVVRPLLTTQRRRAPTSR